MNKKKQKQYTSYMVYVALFLAGALIGDEINVIKRVKDTLKPEKRKA